MLETSTTTVSAEIPGQSGLVFNLLPVTRFVARCYMVIEEGLQAAGSSKIALAKCRLGFELPLNKHKFHPGEKPTPFTISLLFTRSFEENAKFRKMLESWLGTPFTNQSIPSFRMEQMIGKTCQIIFTRKANKDARRRTQFRTILPLADETACPPAILPTLYYTVEWGRDHEAFKRLPNWLQAQIPPL